MAQKIKVIIKRPDEEYGHVTNISNTLENLQKTVDGYIETVTLPRFTLIVNEEGRLDDSPFNCNIAGINLFGTIIVVGTQDDEFADVGINFGEWKKIIDRWRWDGKPTVLIGAKAVSRCIGMSLATFHRHKDVDEIPYYRNGRTICARLQDLEDWVSRQIEKERQKDDSRQV